jgi:methyl-accepting chemotaxis protein
VAERVRFGLFPKLFVAMTLIAVIPLGAIWWLDYRSTAQRLSQDLDQRLRSQAESTAAAVDAWVDMNLRMARQNAALDAITGMDGKTQHPVLRSIADEYKWVYLIHTLGLNGMDVGRNDDEAMKDYKDRAYFQAVAGGAPVGQQVVIGKTSGQPALILAVPIKAKDRLAGVFSIATSVDDVSNRVTNIHLGRTGFAFLVDREGLVIAHPTFRGSLKTHPAVEGLGAEKGRKVEFQEKDGRKVVGFAERTQSGWTLVVQQDVAEAYAPVAEANRVALALFALTLVFVAGISWLIARQLASPLLNLTRIAEEISRGALTTRIEEARRSDEIGGLARAIERLSTSVKLAMDRLAK